MREYARPFAVASAAAVLLCGCGASRTRIGSGFNVSSESSDYSPTARLAVSLGQLLSRPDSIAVLIDSGSISAPGLQPAAAPADMSNLYMTALLTTVAPGVIRDPTTSPWTAVAESDSIRVADSLRLGETLRLPAMRFSLPRSATIDPSHTLVAFRITGKASTTDIHLSDGRIIPARVNVGNVRVYACADWTLDGFVDKRRSQGLAKAYSAAC
jgi:hypothetical protein